MKRLVFTLVALLVPAALGAQGITGSAHDFRGDAGFTTETEICVVCHTPHDADISVSDAPLWNHELTTATFQPYAGGGTLDAIVGQPSGASKLCLSCHDGTVALDSYGGSTGSVLITGDALVGTDLRNDHPVSFGYDAALATTDGGLHDPTTTSSGIGGTPGNIDEDMLFGASNDQMECASCHDVHDAAGLGGLLLKANTGSALCLTCHDK